MTGKLVEDRVSTDDGISLEELDAEYFNQSVRERIDVAVRAKARQQLPSRYFYEIIEEAVDDFLVEERIRPKNQQRSDEIQAAYNELIPAFHVLREHVKDDRALDGAIRDVMWGSFLIGLACDWEKNNSIEVLKKYKYEIASKAREAKKKKSDRWSVVVYEAVCLAIPYAMLHGVKMTSATKTHEYAKYLYAYVRIELDKMKLTDDLKLKTLTSYAIKMAVCRYIDEKNARRLHKRKKPRTLLKEPS